MPIAIIATEGILSPQSEQSAFAEITASFLRLHGLSGNPFLAPNIIGEIQQIPKGKSFAGGKPADIVIVELKVPSFVLATEEQKRAFVAEATAIMLRAGGGRIGRERIYVNMVFAVDGLWGIDGRTYTIQELGEAVAAAA
jgi:phenylpyruvate tautomerase PptA (4-oxalocrotonate tautomerase family)